MTTPNPDIHLPVDSRLTGKSNFESWKKQFLLLARVHGIKDLLDSDFPVPDKDVDPEKWSKYDRQDALLQLLITINCEGKITHTIADIQGGKACWDTLGRKYKKTNQEMIDDYNNISYEKCGSIPKYIEQFKENRRILLESGSYLDEREQPRIFLNGLKGQFRDWVRKKVAEVDSKNYHPGIMDFLMEDLEAQKG